MDHKAKVFEVISPHTEQSIAQVAAAGPAEVEAAVAAARAAFDSGPWGRCEPSDRIAVIRRLADLYDQRRAEMAETITAEIGAPISFAQRAQVGLPAMMMRAFCGLAQRHPWQEARRGFFGADVQVHKEPVGVIAAIVPWNMPQFLIITKLVPALLAGCTVVLKPAPESALDAALLAEMIGQIDLPPGVVRVVQGDGAVGGLLVGHPGVDKVSFTGSTPAGRAVASACAANLTKVSLEMSDRNRCPRRRYLRSAWPGQIRRAKSTGETTLNEGRQDDKPSWITAQSGRLSHVEMSASGCTRAEASAQAPGRLAVVP
jgi:acyl-CoA reductase-like NAD-dependent aldehyde dehydrogenase